MSKSEQNKDYYEQSQIPSKDGTYDIKVSTCAELHFTGQGLTLRIIAKTRDSQKKHKINIFLKNNKHAISLNVSKTWKNDIKENFVDAVKQRYENEYIDHLIKILTHTLSKEEMKGLGRERIQWYKNVIQILHQTIQPIVKEFHTIILKPS